MSTKVTPKRPEKRQQKAGKPRAEMEINLRRRRERKVRLILGTPEATAGSLARVVRQFHREREAGRLTGEAVKAYRAEAHLFRALLAWREFEHDVNVVEDLQRRIEALEAGE